MLGWDAGTRSWDTAMGLGDAETPGRDAGMALGDGMLGRRDAAAGCRDSTPVWDAGPLGFPRPLVPLEVVLPTSCSPCSPLGVEALGPSWTWLPEELDAVWSAETGGHPGGADGHQGSRHIAGLPPPVFRL